MTERDNSRVRKMLEREIFASPVRAFWRHQLQEFLDKGANTRLKRSMLYIMSALIRLGSVECLLTTNTKGSGVFIDNQRKRDLFDYSQ
jgi:hypothetical protein